MAKTRRGKGLYRTPGRARGTCPVCGRTGIKLLYPRVVEGETVSVCKHCRPKR